MSCKACGIVLDESFGGDGDFSSLLMHEQNKKAIIRILPMAISLNYDPNLKGHSNPMRSHSIPHSSKHSTDSATDVNDKHCCLQVNCLQQPSQNILYCF